MLGVESLMVERAVQAWASEVPKPPDLAVGEPIPIEPKKGWLLVVTGQRKV